MPTETVRIYGRCLLLMYAWRDMAEDCIFCQEGYSIGLYRSQEDVARALWIGIELKRPRDLFANRDRAFVASRAG